MEEEQSWGATSDIASRADNTTRVQRHLKELEQLRAEGFQQLPDVQKVLEYHVEPVKDPTLAIRTVYGHWFPNFVLIDENWLKQNLSKIFPAEETGRDLRVAAWGTHLHACDVYKNIFNALKEGHTPRSTRRVRTHQTSPNIESGVAI